MDDLCWIASCQATSGRMASDRSSSTHTTFAQSSGKIISNQTAEYRPSSPFPFPVDRQSGAPSAKIVSNCRHGVIFANHEKLLSQATRFSFIPSIAFRLPCPCHIQVSGVEHVTSGADDRIPMPKKKKKLASRSDIIN